MCRSPSQLRGLSNGLRSPLSIFALLLVELVAGPIRSTQRGSGVIALFHLQLVKDVEQTGSGLKL